MTPERLAEIESAPSYGTNLTVMELCGAIHILQAQLAKARSVIREVMPILERDCHWDLLARAQAMTETEKAP